MTDEKKEDKSCANCINAEPRKYGVVFCSDILWSLTAVDEDLNPLREDVEGCLIDAPTRTLCRKWKGRANEG